MSAQTSLRHINLPASAEHVGQAETWLNITLTVPLSHPFTSLRRNWFRAPTLPSDWLEHFFAVWEAGMFTTAFVDRWGPQWRDFFHYPLTRQQWGQTTIMFLLRMTSNMRDLILDRATNVELWWMHMKGQLSKALHTNTITICHVYGYFKRISGCLWPFSQASHSTEVASKHDWKNVSSTL